MCALDTPEHAVARGAVEDAESHVRTAEEAKERHEATVEAKELQIDYLRAIAGGGPDGASMPENPDELTAQLSKLGGELERLQTEIIDDRAGRILLEENVDVAETQVAEAKFRLAALRPFENAVDVLAMDVAADRDASLQLIFSHLVSGVGWQPAYEVRLDTETNRLTIDRSFVLDLGADEVWNDVDVTVSADNPDRPQSTIEPSPSPARITDPVERTRVEGLTRESRGLSQLDLLEIAEVPVLESRMVVPQGYGLSLSYRLTNPVSSSGSGVVVVEHDQLGFDATLINLAIPRRDRTAFLVAEFENESGEPLLPGGARYFRDGALIADGAIGLVPSGAKTEFGFGPLDHLQLEWQNLSLDEGDRGFIRQSNTQSNRIAFSVENLSSAAEPVRVLYATPFAEQENLTVDVQLSPQADTQDWDDRRGVVAWEIELEPGEARDFEVTVDLRWPEGKVLDWRP